MIQLQWMHGLHSVKDAMSIKHILNDDETVKNLPLLMAAFE